MPERPLVPEVWVLRLGTLLTGFPDCREESAWVGTRWRVRQATVAHVFGGEDQRLRITFRAEPDEVAAFEHFEREPGSPYFRSGWGHNVVGLLLPDHPDHPDGPDDPGWWPGWDELTELLTDSYCLQAPARLAARVERPRSDPRPGVRGP